MIPRPPRSTRTDTLFPYTTLFRSSRFELLLPFGCSGPSEAGTSLPMQWRYDEADGTLRVSVKPMMWSEADWNLDDRASTAAAEGFWITRPWSDRKSTRLNSSH